MSKSSSKILKLLFSIIILVVLFKHLDISISDIFINVEHKGYILLSIVIPIAVIPFISSNRWKLFLSHVNVQESIWTLMRINFISMFQGIILPSSQGFDVLRIYYIEKRHPEQRGKVGSTILIERMIGFVVLCLLSLFFSIIVEIPNKKQILIIISAICLALLGAIVLLLNKKLNAILSSKQFKNKYINKVYSYFTKFSNSLAYFPYNKVLLSSIGLILLFQLSTIASVFLIFKAYGIDIPFYTHISLYPIISILSLIPITISGFGIRESFFVYFYSMLGVPPEIAVAVSLMNYIVLTIVPALFGALIYMINTFNKKELA